jgi:hypothetical protein
MVIASESFGLGSIFIGGALGYPKGYQGLKPPKMSASN